MNSELENRQKRNLPKVCLCLFVFIFTAPMFCTFLGIYAKKKVFKKYIKTVLFYNLLINPRVIMKNSVYPFNLILCIFCLLIGESVYLPRRGASRALVKVAEIPGHLNAFFLWGDSGTICNENTNVGGAPPPPSPIVTPLIPRTIWSTDFAYKSFSESFHTFYFETNNNIINIQSIS